MSPYIKLTAMLAIRALLPSCKPDDDNVVCVAGQGGNITLAVFPKHHSKAVRPYSVWLQYKTKNAPANASDYDLVVPADTTEDHIHLANMKCGDYYIYMNGYDTAIREAVKGGIPYTVPGTGTTEIAIDVPVTE